MLPITLTFLPALVTVLTLISFFNSSFSFSNWAFLASYSAIVASSGFKIIIPSLPSTIILSPLLAVCTISLRPTTAGISNVLAIIALCEVLPPMFVTKAITFDLSNWAVSEGVKSWATITVLFSTSERSSTIPARFLRILVPTSFTSATLSLMYSSSIESKIAINISNTSVNAFSAFICLSLIVFSIAPVNSGSSSIIIWLSKTAALSAPTSFSALSFIFSNCVRAKEVASFNLATSASTSSMCCSTIFISFSSLTNTLPIAYPFDAAIPVFIINPPSNFKIHFI